MKVSFAPGQETFLSTPVENMFINEAMASAPGDFVKVYLYGLMLCSYPAMGAVNPEEMGMALNLTPDIVREAFAYWNRHCLVRIVSEEPFSLEYLSVQQNMRQARMSLQMYRYEEFFRRLRALLGDRMLTRGEQEKIYDWLENLKLEEDAALALLELGMRRGKSRGLIAYCDEIAHSWAEQGITTGAKAREKLAEEDADHALARQILAYWRMNRPATLRELDYCRKWLREWGLETAAVLTQLERINPSRPTFGYLDRALDSLRKKALTGEEAARKLDAEETETRELREVFSQLGYYGALAPALRELYREWRGLGFDSRVLAEVAREMSSRTNRPEDLDTKLRDMAARQIITPEDLDARKAALEKAGEAFAPLIRLWREEREPRNNEKTRMLSWQEKGYDPALIEAAARRCGGVRNRLAAMDKLLAEWREKGLTPQQALAEAPAPAAAGRGLPGVHFANERTESEDPPDYDWLTEEPHEKK